MSSRELEERQEREFGEWVASELGITFDELCSVDWSIDEDTLSDGTPTGMIITFGPASDDRVLARIAGLHDGEWARINLPPGERDWDELS